MKKWSKVFAFVLISAFMLGASTTAFADVQAVMALDPGTQQMYLAIRTDCDFEGYFTITPESLIVAGYDNTIDCGEFCMPDYTCFADFALEVTDLPPAGTIVSFHVDIYDTNDVVVGSTDDALQVKSPPSRDGEYFDYLDDCEHDVPSIVSTDPTFDYCMWLCHRTFVIPIDCHEPLQDVPVFRITPGCDADLAVDPEHLFSSCSYDTCAFNADPTVLSWYVTIPDTTNCLAYLIIIYCDADPGCACIKAPDWILPVELSAFAAYAGDGYVNLAWTTASETNNNYFDVQRRTYGTDWISVGHVDGHGTVSTATDYEFSDNSVTNGVTYSYRLLSYDFNGARHIYNSIEATPGTVALPTAYALEQNYPNPFNPQTTITYAVKDPGFVSLKVYNLIGQEVATLVSNTMEAGRYTVNFTADNLPSGIYLYTMTAGEFSQTQKMLLLK